MIHFVLGPFYVHWVDFILYDCLIELESLVKSYCQGFGFLIMSEPALLQSFTWDNFYMKELRPEEFHGSDG